ncbi:MAG TPA: hypothetical protein VJ550_03605 [Geomonas sp.]|nr:hypothetical protein [Geomonas sp.]
MTASTDPIDRRYQNASVNDLIVTAKVAGKKQKDHAAFKEKLPEYVYEPDQLDDLASKLEMARDAAVGHDTFRVAEMKAIMVQTVLALDNNADHVVKVSRHRNDPSILLESGYDLKPETVNVKEKTKLLDLVPELSAKHVMGVPGAILAILKLAVTKASVELQMTETPDSEESWKGIGQGIYNRSRIEIRGLEQAKKIYLRARYHQDGGVGRWSQPVAIIVL